MRPYSVFKRLTVVLLWPWRTMSDFLFASPSFVTGCARAIDLGGVMNRWSYNMSRTPEEADLRAIHNDWKAVGRDLRKASEKVASEVPQE
jgi:hypothetical protein